MQTKQSGPACTLCGAQRSRPFYFAERETWQFWHCSDCDLVFKDPVHYPPPEEEHKRYLTHENDPKDEGYRRFLQPVFETVCREKSPGADGLDYGAGPGPALAQMLSEAGYTTATYDPIFAPDPTPLSRTYDFVTCTEAAEHFYRPEQDFNRLKGLLRENGILVVMTGWRPAPDAFKNWYYWRDPTHVCFYSEATLAWIGSHYCWDVSFPAPNVTLFRNGSGLVKGA